MQYSVFSEYCNNVTYADIHFTSSLYSVSLREGIIWWSFLEFTFDSSSVVDSNYKNTKYFLIETKKISSFNGLRAYLRIRAFGKPLTVFLILLEIEIWPLEKQAKGS